MYILLLKQYGANRGGNRMQAFVDCILLLGNYQEEVIADRDPYLCVDRILRSAIERFDMEMLLYPFEEQLNLPSLPIKLSYRNCLNAKVVGKEFVYVPRGKVLVFDKSERVRILLRRKHASEPDGFVCDESCLAVHWPFLNDFVFGIVLGSGDKVGIPFLDELVEVLEIHIPFVYEVKRVGFYRHLDHDLGIMDSPICEMHEGWYGTPEINEHVHFHGTLIMVEPSPRAELEAEFNGGTVKCIHHIVQPQSEVIICIQGLCFSDENLSKVLIYSVVLLLVGFGKRGFWHDLKAAVIKIAGTKSQGCLYVSKAGTVGKLRKAHYAELVSAGIFDGGSVAFVAINALFELIFINETHDLRKYCLSGSHDFVFGPTIYEIYFVIQKNIIVYNLLLINLLIHVRKNFSGQQ